MREQAFVLASQDVDRHVIRALDDAYSQPDNEQPGAEAEHTDMGTDAQRCVVCYSNLRDTFLNCGHLICEECSKQLLQCPCCRTEITERSRAFV